MIYKLEIENSVFYGNSLEIKQKLLELADGEFVPKLRLSLDGKVKNKTLKKMIKELIALGE